MNRWKRMCKFLIPLALALFFVGLSRCGTTEMTIEAMGIEKMALQYLSEQYSAEFTIINWWREPREKSPIPIPSIIPSYNFELEVISDQFPEDKFHLHYRKDLDTKKWEWSDDYYTILLNAEAQEYFSEYIKPCLDIEYVIDIIWGISSWPDGTGEETSFEDWLKAGGKILVVGIYFNGITPLDNDCKPIATKLLSDNPSVANVRFYGLTGEAFSQTVNKDIAEIWDDNEQSQLGRLSYHQWDIQESTP